MIRFKEKEFSSTVRSRLKDINSDIKKSDRQKERSESIYDNYQDGFKKDRRALRRSIRKDKNGLHEHEHDALKRILKKEEFEVDLNKRMSERATTRAQERKDLSVARAREDAAGIGNGFRRKIQDAGIAAKYKLQDLSDNYYKGTEGRSLAGDAALATAGLAGGYLAYKAIKKAKYDKEQAKLAAENKFKR